MIWFLLSVRLKKVDFKINIGINWYIYICHFLYVENKMLLMCYFASEYDLFLFFPHLKRIKIVVMEKLDWTIRTPPRFRQCGPQNWVIINF